jgi:hypothetical protein
MDVKQRVFEHELDASWIIALWFAIHGGDPPPEKGILDRAASAHLAATIIQTLATTLDAKTQHAIVEALPKTAPQHALKTTELMNQEHLQQRMHALKLPVTFNAGGDEGRGCCVGTQHGLVCVRLAV